MAWSEIQKAINSNINEALDILTKRLIGVNTDISDTTVFGKLNEKVRPYKQLKLNKVTSPICTASNQPKGVMVDYNSTYYLIASDTTLWKIRKSDDVIIGSVSIANVAIPIILNDFAFCFSPSSPLRINCIDLINMTSKSFSFPTTSSGAITVTTTKNQHFDVRFVSGNQYQCLIWVDGATADGIIVCTLDTTATSGATMAQVSWNPSPGVPTGINACCFGMNGDTNYYYAGITWVQKAPITTGIQSTLIAGITDLQLLDLNSFRSCQTTDYLVLQVKPTTGSGLSDVIMIKKSNGDFSYCGIECEEILSIFVPCQIKNANYCVFALAQSVIAIKNDKTISTIIKPQSTLFNNYVINNNTTAVNANGQRCEGVLNHDIENKKITLASACYYDTTTLANTNTFAIREYDIV